MNAPTDTNSTATLVASRSREETRRRAVVAIFSGAALSTTGYLVAGTVTALVAHAQLGSPAWSGVPAAVLVLGTAVGSSALALVMRRSSPRGGMIAGYSLSGLAALMAAFAVQRDTFPLFLAATFFLGFGYGANRLARYSAADLFPAERQATVIGWIVWAATLGAIAGPSLAEPASNGSRWAGLHPLVGPYVASALGMLAAAAVSLAIPGQSALSRPTPASPAVAVARATRSASRDGVRVALAAMVSAQVAMVLLMTMTPLHMQHDGAGLTRIGLVLSAHTLGMYALAPITGRLTDRFGARPIIFAGAVVLLAACLVGAIPSAGTSPLMFTSLGGIGLGWNLAFIAGSALLTTSASPADRQRLQGLGDSCLWGAGAVAGLLSGVLLHASSFRALALLSAGVSLLPLAVWLASRSRVEPS